MRNLARISNYYNRIEAVKDWERIASVAQGRGYDELVSKHTPPADSGWRTIDKCIAALRKDMEAVKAKA